MRLCDDLETLDRLVSHDRLFARGQRLERRQKVMGKLVSAH